MLTAAISLLILAIILCILEIFIPSGGLLGFSAFVSAIASIVCVFQINPTAGYISVGVFIVGAPLIFFLGLNLFPYTPVGKRLILKQNPKPDVIYDELRDKQRDSLVGTIGHVVTDLRPVGLCEINGKRVECIAKHGVITAGTKIKVESVSGLEIKVQHTN